MAGSPLAIITSIGGGALAALGLGTPGLGSDLARQAEDETAQRRKKTAPGPGAPDAFGDQTLGTAARSLLG